MKLFIDNIIVKALSHNHKDILSQPLIADIHNEIIFGWPSLLEFLELGNLFKNLAGFDQSQPIFQAYLVTLSAKQEVEVVQYLFDTLFAECLAQIKSLPEINPIFLLDKIKMEQEKSSFQEIEKMLSPTLNYYEISFRENSSQMMHNLILYLAWDRMCVYVSRLFDHPSNDFNFIKNLEVLKNCLIESFQYITQDGRTVPGFYRLAEALFYFYMREENLQKHLEAEWLILNQSVSGFNSQDELADLLYIDQAITLKGSEVEEITECFLTLDSQDKVDIRLLFAIYIMERLQLEFSNWNYTFLKKNIICINYQSC